MTRAAQAAPTLDEASFALDLGSHPSPEDLAAYHYQELTAAEQDALQDHLAMCSQCLGFLRDLFEETAQAAPLSAAELKNLWNAIFPEAFETESAPAPSSGEDFDDRPQRFDRFVGEVLAWLRPGLEEQFSRCLDTGHDPEEVGSAEEIARRMLTAVLVPSGWNDSLGPFYTTRQVAGLLNISPRAVRGRHRHRTLWGLKTADGLLVFPALQFGEDNQILPGLQEVLSCFRDSPVDDWTLAGWLAAPRRELGGFPVLRWLLLELETDPLISLAADAARRFGQ